MFFDRFKRSQCLSQDGLRLDQASIVNNPQFRPTFQGRQLSRSRSQVELAGHAFNAMQLENIAQMANHQRIFGTIYSFHLRTIHRA